MGARTIARGRRSGLSTLEFVVALPILLMVMALIVNVGALASWKVRALGVARNELWSQRFPRSGTSYPRPANWPTTAGLAAGAGGPIASLDDPRVNLPVVRGPMVDDFGVNQNLLDPKQGMQNGSADLQRAFAMLRRLGAYHLRALEQAFSQDSWQFETRGLYWNRERRIPHLYVLPSPPNEAMLENQYLQAVVAIYYASFQKALWPLDTDDEFINYGYRFGWGRGAPDFHPRLGGFCDTDEVQVKTKVNDLIDRIQGNKAQRIPSVADVMTQAFIGLYQRVINELQRQLSAVPPPPPSQAAAIRKEISDLQAKIQQLQQPLGSP